MRTKKSMTRMLALMCLLGGATLAANAQSSRLTVGATAGVATYNDGGYADVFMQCDVANHVRVVPEIGYIFRNDGKSGFEASLDVQMPFPLAKRVSVYPLMGVTYNYWKYSHHGGSANRVGVDVGAGLDIGITSDIKLIIQGKGSLMNDTGGGFFSVGFGYRLH